MGRSQVLREFCKDMGSTPPTTQTHMETNGTMVQIHPSQEWLFHHRRHEHPGFSVPRYQWPGIAKPEQEQCAQLDYGEFQDILTHFGYVTLNTWSKAGRHARTFLPAGYHHDQAGTQIDFICACMKLADGKSRRAKPVLLPFVPHTGGRHIPVIAEVPLPKIPKTKNANRRPLIQDCCDKLQYEEYQLKFKAELQQQLNTGTNINNIDQILTEAWKTTCLHSSEPSSNVALTTPSSTPSLVRQLWSLRQLLRRKQPAHKASVFQLWVAAVKLQNVCRLVRKAHRQRKQAVIDQILASTSVFRAARRLAPKQPRRRMQLRDADGRLQTYESEFSQIVSYYQALYAGPMVEQTSLLIHFTSPRKRYNLHCNSLQPGKSCPQVMLLPSYGEEHGRSSHRSSLSRSTVSKAGRFPFQNPGANHILSYYPNLVSL